MIPDPEQRPVSTPRGIAREARVDLWCEFCDAECGPEDWNEAAALTICSRCIEEMLDATAFNARTALGLVGASR